DAGAGDIGDLPLGRRIDHVEARAVGGFFPFAADPEIGRDIGEKVVVSGHVDSPLSFRGARPSARSRASLTRYGREPGIQKQTPCAAPASGFGAARRPGMTEPSYSTSSSPDRRCDRRSAGWRLREYRPPA